MIAKTARAFEVALACLTVALLIVLAVLVVAAVAFRYSGNSLIWYDELAEVLLAWITFMGAGYASLKRAHLGADTLVLRLPLRLRFVAFCLSELIVVAIFAVVAVYGYWLLSVFRGETLVALTWLPRAATQSCIPIGAVLIIAAQFLSAPSTWRRLAAGVSQDEAEIEVELSRVSKP